MEKMKPDFIKKIILDALQADLTYHENVHKEYSDSCYEEIKIIVDEFALLDENNLRDTCVISFIDGSWIVEDPSPDIAIHNGLSADVVIDVDNEKLPIVVRKHRLSNSRKIQKYIYNNYIQTLAANAEVKVYNESFYGNEDVKKIFDEIVRPEVKVVGKHGGTKMDGDKAQYSLLPPDALRAVAEVMTEGAKKYSKDNWKGLELSRVLDALGRHLNAFESGEEVASDSGQHHLAHALANVMMAYHITCNFPEQDDRLFKYLASSTPAYTMYDVFNKDKPNV